MPSTKLHALLTAAALVFGAPAPAAAAAQGTASDETSKGYAFIEVVLPERAPFVGEVFTLRLRAGVDVDVLEANLVQMFRQPLDVPVQLDHAWFDGGALAHALGPARAAIAGSDGSVPSAPELARVALGAELAAAARHVERGADGRRFTVLEFERAFVSDAPGALAVPEARLGFAYALKFREDLVAGRVALDRNDAFVRGKPQELSVRSLPETGRPFSFTGAVGRYALSANVAPERLEPDATALLTVALTAEGPNAAAIGRFSGPRLDRFEGFKVVASRDTTVGSTRTFEIELAPANTGTLSMGPIEFATFDPVAERYVELATPRLSVQVGKPRDVETVPNGERAPSASATDESPAPDELGFDVALPFLLQVGAAVVVMGLALALIVAIRRGR